MPVGVLTSVLSDDGHTLPVTEADEMTSLWHSEINVFKHAIRRKCAHCKRKTGLWENTIVPHSFEGAYM